MSDPENTNGTGPFDIMEVTRQTLLKMGNSAAFRAQTEGQYLINLVSEAAQKNVTGPEAVFCRRVQALLTEVLPRLRLLQGQGDQQNELAAVEQAFYRDLAMAAAGLRDALEKANNSSAFESIKAKLPAYIREAIERKGLWIPGLPGGLQPSGGVPPNGVTWQLRF